MNEPKLSYLTNSNSMQTDMPKIFCSCHPEDAKILPDICNDLLTVLDCMVFYYPEGVEPDAEQAETDLQHMNLFVPIISAKAIFQDCFVSNHVFRIADKYGIPVLPIMLEAGLEEDFDRRFGNIQCLLKNGNAVDATSLPYEEKLKNSLTSILNTDIDRQKLRNAFDASIFLSYRKKDRASAQELIRIIHEDETCRNISIWYDEFLIPGEDFNDNIRSELEQSSVFVMVVTPHVTEENNYIQIVEYPLAVSLGKTVIPCELIETPVSRMTECYPGINSAISAVNAEEVHKAIIDSINKMGINPAESTAEKEYLMGISYLNGIGTEKNPEIARQLILSAAEAGEPNAMRRAAVMYQYGLAVERNIDTAIEWQQKLITYLKESYDENDDAKIEWCREVINLADLLGINKNYMEAYDTYSRIPLYARNEKYKNNRVFLHISAEACELKAKLYRSQGWSSQARAFGLRFAIESRERIHELEKTKESALELTEAYLMDGQCCVDLQYLPGVQETIIKVLEVMPDTDIEKDGHYAHILVDLDHGIPSADEYAYIVRLLTCCNELSKLYIVTAMWYSAEKLVEATMDAAGKLAAAVPTYDTKRLVLNAYLNDADRNAGYLGPGATETAYQKARRYAEGLYEEFGLTESLLDIAEIDLKTVQWVYRKTDKKKALDICSEAYASLEKLYEETPLYHIKKLLLKVSVEHSALNYMLGNKDAAYPEMKSAVADAEKIYPESYNYTDLLEYADILATYATMLKQDWELDEAVAVAEKRRKVLQSAMEITGHRIREMKIYLSALSELLDMYNLNADFDKVDEVQNELDHLQEEYAAVMPKNVFKMGR